ncbi:MAG: HAD family phosphatase [Legionella sp.]
MKIKNIIFDLGGVLLNLDKKLTVTALNKLGARESNGDTLKDLILNFEMGTVSAKTVREKFQLATEMEASDKEFDAAWNAMLLDIPKEHFELLNQLKSKYTLFLFSNTNEIHYQQLLKIYERDQGSYDFHGFFKAVYYSHLLHLRKPDLASYKEILRLNNLKPDETLFIDDSKANVDAAIWQGIHAIHLTVTTSLLNLPQLILDMEKAKSDEIELSDLLATYSLNK